MPFFRVRPGIRRENAPGNILIMTTSDAYTELRARLQDIQNLRAAAAVLEWDQEVCMPPRGAAARGRQLATLTALAHARFTAPETGELITRVRDVEAQLDADQQAWLAAAAYNYDRATRIPESFMRRFAETKSAAYHGWLEARRQSDFQHFLPHLEALVALAREKAERLGYAGEAYDALLEDYERGMTAAQLRALFAVLADRQSRLAARIRNAPVHPDMDWMDQDWPIDRQWSFTERVLRDMGYDFEAGRQDKSAHPFTTSFSIGDVRVTTRLNTQEFFSALFGSIHEGGHALYEQGYRADDEGTLLADAPSLGMHESQSRLWENIIGRSLAFWRHYLPALRDAFPGQMDTMSPEKLYASANRVAPSLIRVEADECTYNLHIILRFELETALVSGALAAADVPDAWNEKMRQYLGIDVPDDARGCLQDIHWSHGAFGYFPTYALGNLYAAQLYDAMCAQMPDLSEQIEAGRFDGIRDWLRAQVHRVGRRKTAVALINDVCGAAPTPEPFLHYLESKYSELYALGRSVP